MRWSSSQYRAALNNLGTFFGLLVVAGLFGALLGLKDISDQRQKHLSQQDGAAAAHWWQAARECPFDGLKAFVSVANIKTVLAQTVIVAIGALGMTMIIVSGGIDLSVGSSVALTSVLGATLLVKGWPPLAVVLVMISAGGLVGLVNGAIISS